MILSKIESEQAMIGCILLGRHEYIVQLTAKDFSSDCYALVLEAMQKLSEKGSPIDLITVSDQVHDKVENILQILTATVDSVSSAELAPYVYEKVKEYTAKRALAEIAKKITERLQDELADIDTLKGELITDIEQAVKGTTKEDCDIKTILSDTIMEMEREYRDNQPNKYLTGYYDLDDITAGLHPEELTIIAARPSVGKTAVCLNIAINMAERGLKCVFISREMSRVQLMKRILSHMTPIDGNKLRKCNTLEDKDWERIANTVGKIGMWRMLINDELASVQSIRAYCRGLKVKDMIDVLFVDYLQLCRSSKKHESRRQEIEEVSRQFKEMAMEFKIPVVVLSQLSRDSVKEKRIPGLHDLRESGSIEQDADNVIFLHVREEDFDTNEFDLQILVGKQRNGATGQLFLRFHKSVMKLFNISRRQI